MRKRISPKVTVTLAGNSKLASTKVKTLPKIQIITKRSKGFINPRTMSVGYNHVAYMNH